MSDQNTGVVISHHDHGSGGKYVADIPGEKATGTLEWEPQSDGVRIATHTIVPPEIGGRGIAALLVERLIADAREHGFKVVPQCWYVAKKFDENPGWSDLRA
ncbi:GNAT family N-acetyltransferase [uncultured Erythrobacter sp.]|uniref:GNAT family N-acetyltransferase n=1 Tax=uncultured Erythrobacter sp. TaxID=263913 RepID=UPI00260CD67B|nr:GNAT family N-acetyltransferase [uncultured Erythrobacter sp.]